MDYRLGRAGSGIQRRTRSTFRGVVCVASVRGFVGEIPFSSWEGFAGSASATRRPTTGACSSIICTQ